MERLKNTYVMKEFGINFLVTFLVLMFLFSLGGFIRSVELVVLGTFTLPVLIKFFLLAVSATATYIIPISFLCAVTALFTRLAADREMLIFSSSGIRPSRLLGWLAVATLLISAGLFYFNFEVLPRARLAQRNILNTLRFKDPLSVLQKKNFVRSIPGTTIYVGDLNDDDSFRDIIISYQDASGRMTYLSAREGKADYAAADNALRFALTDGLLLVYQTSDRKDLVKMKFATYEFILPLPEEYRKRVEPRFTELAFSGVIRKLRSLTVEEEMELDRRAVFACAPLVFLLFGAGLGMRLRQKSRSFNLGIGAAATLAFFELMTVGEIVARKSGASAWVWLPIVVFGVSGLCFWRRQ